MRNKKKMLFVINSLECGGAEKSLISLLPLIDYEKYEVDIQMFNIEGMFLKLLPGKVNILPELEFLGFCKKRLLEQLFSRNSKYVKTRIKLYFELMKNRKRRKLHDAQVFWKTCTDAFDFSEKHYDVAIAWGQGNPTHYVADKVFALKKFAWINADYEAVGHNKDFDREYYKKYNSIVTVSNQLQKIIKEVFPEFSEKVEMMPDIQNQDLIYQMSKIKIDTIKRAHTWRLITVGRLVSSKGYDIAIEAGKYLNEQGINFEWFIIGEGPERKVIEEQIELYNLRERFFLLGAQSNPYPYMKSADIYVQTSKNEGYCLTLAEARILNLPCVTTNFTVVYSQIVNEENGLIVGMTGKDVSEGIKRLIKEERLKMKIVSNLENEKKGNIEEIQKFYEIVEE